MADALSPPVKKRRLRWPLLLLAIAMVAVITVQWIVPIAMEQRAIAVIRTECARVRIVSPGVASPLTPPPSPPKSTKDSLDLLNSVSRVTTIGATSFAKAEYVEPAIIREFTGHKLLRIESITGNAEDFRPAADQLRWLRHVTDVSLWGASDEDADYLRHFTNVESLTLLNSKLTDSGLARLNTLRALRQLKIRQGQVRGSGFAALANLNRLEELEITLTPLNDEGLKNIGNLSELNSLLLVGASVNDEGLAYLADLNHLESLSLVGTDITDAGLKHLLPLSNLKNLDLSETQVTLDGIPQLNVLPNLHHLRLGGFDLSDAQLDELEQTLPGCEVTRY